MIGLARGKVELCVHEPAWEDNAARTIIFLKDIFGETAVDIQHAGSTAIKLIMAKPIIDIVAGVNDFGKAKALLPLLAEAGVVHRPQNDLPEYMMFVMGDLEKGIRTHHIHVVPFEGEEWINQLNFRDYLSARPQRAKEYEALKIDLMKRYSDNRPMYTGGKQSFINGIFTEAAEWRRMP
ncbi:MAG: GrpB family protein [Defluviitaleaceae bacterium]|nr:GrpB family protein [Defluviitaleaceae bacterium]